MYKRLVINRYDMCFPQALASETERAAAKQGQQKETRLPPLSRMHVESFIIRMLAAGSVWPRRLQRLVGKLSQTPNHFLAQDPIGIYSVYFQHSGRQTLGAQFLKIS